MDSINIFQAISIWFSGGKIDDLALSGLPVVWISRGAKLISFGSGLTIVLDVIGPDRVREYGENLLRATRGQDLIVGAGFFVVILLVPFLPIAIAQDYVQTRWLQIPFLILFVLILFTIPIVAIIKPYIALIGHALAGFGSFFRSRESQMRFRVIAMLLFFVGFTLDMFTS